MSNAFLLRGAHDVTLEQKNELIERLLEGDLLFAVKSPDKVTLVAAKVLRANKDPIADQIIEIGTENLRKHAVEIED